MAAEAAAAGHSHGAGAAAGDILFYNRGEPYFEFTNFYEAAIDVGGQRYRTSEHYFQSQKFPDRPDLQRRVRDALTCRAAFEMVRRPQSLELASILGNTPPENVELSSILGSTTLKM